MKNFVLAMVAVFAVAVAFENTASAQLFGRRVVSKSTCKTVETVKVAPTCNSAPVACQSECASCNDGCPRLGAVLAAPVKVVGATVHAVGNVVGEVLDGCKNGRCEKVCTPAGCQTVTTTTTTTTTTTAPAPASAAPAPPVKADVPAAAPSASDLPKNANTHVNIMYIEGVPYGQLPNGTYANMQNGTYSRLTAPGEPVFYTTNN